MFCCFKASEQVHNNIQFPHATLSCLFDYQGIFKITSLTVLQGLADMAVRMWKAMAKRISCFCKPAGLFQPWKTSLCASVHHYYLCSYTVCPASYEQQLQITNSS